MVTLVASLLFCVIGASALAVVGYTLFCEKLETAVFESLNIVRQSCPLLFPMLYGK